MFKHVHHYLLIIISLGIYYDYFEEYHTSGVFSAIGFLILFVLYGATLIYTVYRFVKDKRPVPRLHRAAPLLMGIGLACSFALVNWFVETDGWKKVVLSARRYKDLNVITLDLRSDHTFKLFNGGPFGGDYYWGKYQLEKDTLRIDTDALLFCPKGVFVMVTDSSQRRYFVPVTEDSTIRKNGAYYRLEINPMTRNK